MGPTTPWEPPVLYSWDLATATSGTCGVSCSEFKALRALTQALRSAPEGTSGSMRRVVLSSVTSEYVYGTAVLMGTVVEANKIRWSGE